MKKIYERLRYVDYDIYFKNNSIIIPEKKITVYWDKIKNLFCIEFIYERQKFQQNMIFSLIFYPEKLLLKGFMNAERNKIFKIVYKILNILFGAGLALISVFYQLWCVSGFKYNTLLLQIGSVKISEFNIILEDYGLACFFINDKELANMNFNDIFFRWDCY